LSPGISITDSVQQTLVVQDWEDVFNHQHQQSTRDQG
jgi:hypothetical protein